MKPHKTSAPILILLAVGFVLLNLSGSISAVQAQQVQVNAADPAAAAQGTTNLNVKVTGKGFKKGATAKFLVTGTTDTGGIQVNSTTFVSSGELTANIDVADTAVIANFDIAVANADGRGGKGTELFAVTAKGNQAQDIGVTARFVYCAPPGSDPDSQAAYATCIQQNRIRNDIDRDYVNGEEGIDAVFRIVSGSNDLTVNLLTLPTRRTVIDLYDLVPESAGQLIPSWQSTPQYAKWHFNVRRAYLAKTFCGGSYPCDMTTVMSSTVNVSGDNASYYLQWYPESIRPVNSPEITSRVNVRYDVVNGVETWTVTPLTNGTSGRIVAGLAKAAKNRTDAAGQYFVPFTLTVKLQ
jgi:hypothetical protein